MAGTPFLPPTRTPVPGGLRASGDRSISIARWIIFVDSRWDIIDAEPLSPGAIRPPQNCSTCFPDGGTVGGGRRWSAFRFIFGGPESQGPACRTEPLVSGLRTEELRKFTVEEAPTCMGKRGNWSTNVSQRVLGLMMEERICFLRALLSRAFQGAAFPQTELLGFKPSGWRDTAGGQAQHSRQFVDHCRQHGLRHHEVRRREGLQKHPNSSRRWEDLLPSRRWWSLFIRRVSFFLKRAGFICPFAVRPSCSDG